MRIVWEALGIADLDDLKQAAAGRHACATLKGISASTEERILEGIEKLETRAAPAAHPPRRRRASDDLVEQLRGAPGVDPDRPGGLAPSPPGDDRRPRPARRDGRPEGGHRAVHRTSARSTRSSARGRRRRPSRLLRGPQVDLMVMPPGEAGTYLVHFTGSADHNIRLRGHRARPRLEPVREGLPADRRGRPAADRRRDAELRTFEDEAGAYAFLGLPYIEPELREDRGEIEAARERAPADAHHPRRPARRPATATPTGATASTRSRSWPRRPARLGLRVPGAHRPLAEPGDRPRPDAGPRRAGARDHRRAQRPVRRGGGGRRAAPTAPTPAASGSSTAASSRSAPTATSTTRTSCSPASTSSSPRSTSPAASRGRSSRVGRSTRSAARTSTSSPTRRAG